MTDTLFFWVSKLAWLVLSPDSLLVLLIIATWLLALSPWQTAARRLLIASGVLTLLVATVPVGSWLLSSLEQRFPASTEPGAAPDGIIVLGGSFSMWLSASYEQPQLNDSAERLLTFLALARRYPQARLVFTGGSGVPSLQEVREAEFARQLFSDLGLDPERVIFERESRNTYENAANSRALVNPSPAETWLLITSAYHMPRSMGAFCQQGWKLQAYPVDYQTLAGGPDLLHFGFAANLRALSLAWHELLGLVAYRLTGKTNRLLPAPTDSC